MIFSNLFLETRYKHEVMVDGEPILFEILDTCPKVSMYMYSPISSWRYKFKLFIIKWTTCY